MMCLRYLPTMSFGISHLIFLYRFYVFVYFVEGSDNMKTIVPLPCSCIGHMLNILSPVGSGRSWLEKIHLDFCRVQVKHLVVRDSYTIVQI